MGLITVETVCTPALLNPLMVMGLATGAPAMSIEDKEKTPLASSTEVLVAIGTAARGGDGGAGTVALAWNEVKINPLYVPTSASSARSSKLTAPMLTKTSVPVPPPPPPEVELLVDLVVGAFVDLGPLVDLSVGPLVDLSVGALVDLLVGDLVDFRVGPLVDFEVDELSNLFS